MNLDAVILGLDPSGRPLAASRPAPPLALCEEDREGHQLGEVAAMAVAPQLADPLGALEVGQHEDVEQFGARGGTEGIKPIAKDVLQVHEGES